MNTSGAGAAVREAGGPGERPHSDAAVIRAEALSKSFRSGEARVEVLRHVQLDLREQEMVSIIGPSGSGKSTLLHLLAALDMPSSGTVYFRGKALSALPEAQLAEFRNRSVGFVWQRHHLLPDFTAEENVAMPLVVRGTPLGAALEAARGWLGEVGLGQRATHRAGELSGGEQQRVAIARALVTGPALLLADEPTGDLDEANANAIFDLMQQLHRAHRLTSILATHNLGLARRCDRVLALEHGSLVPAEGLAFSSGHGTPDSSGRNTKDLG